MERGDDGGRRTITKLPILILDKAVCYCFVSEEVESHFTI